MRGDRVGVGDVRVLQDGAWLSGDASCGDDGRGATRQRDRGLLHGHWTIERDEGIQQGGDRVGVSVSAGGWFWYCGFDGDGAVRTYRMRGDRVGVGDIGAVPCGARGSGDALCGDDGRESNRQWDRSILDGRR